MPFLNNVRVRGKELVAESLVTFSNYKWQRDCCPRNPESLQLPQCYQYQQLPVPLAVAESDERQVKNAAFDAAALVNF